MNTRLSKSRFQKGRQCEKALWLSVHTPERADPVSEAKQWIFDQGTEVGRLSQGLFPGGVEVTEDYRHTDEALATTGRLLAEGATVLYEPAFNFDDVLVRVDVLVAAGDGSWDLYEVKSSASLKPENITDAAVQIYVVEGAGLPIRRAHIVHLDTSYVWEGGEYDLSRLFASEDVTADARALLPEVPGILAEFRAMLAGPEPEIRIGMRCRTPYTCDFSGYCHASLGDEHPLTELPYLSEQALHALLDLGITGIGDIPDDFSLLSPSQAAIVRVVKTGLPEVDPASIARELAQLTWPVYHLDFETVNPALPLWPGTHPYTTVPFQYSVHVHHEDGSYEHREHLHTGTDDPRRPLAEHLIADLDAVGSILHYTRFERTRLGELAAALPDLAPALGSIVFRLVDLEPIIRHHTRHPATNGRTSIKSVLPAWCPDLSYGDLSLSDGNTASVRYLRSLRGLLPPDETAALHAELIEYCGMDTFAMLRLLETLREHASGG
jgi:predicted RecB family nuclease